MSVQVERLENNMAKLTIEVAAAEFDKAIKNAYNKEKGKFNVPGFRKGKVPMNMIIKMYGEGVFYNDAIDAIVPGAYTEAAKESGLDIVSRPEDFDVVEIGMGKNFVFTMKVAVKPEVTLGQYKGLACEKAEVTVSDEEVMAAIAKEQEKNAVEVPVTDRAAKEGDTAVIDFEGFVDGVAFDGGKGEEYPLVLGSGSFIPGFEEQLIGKEVGETEVNVTFPEAYQAAELAGKDAMFKVVIKELKAKELPELDDEFASEISETAETVEDLKKEIAAKLTAEKEEAAKTERENKLVDAAVANATMDIPAAMVKAQAEGNVDDTASRMQQQGMDFEQFLQMTGQTREQIIEQFMDQSKKQIETRLVLEAIVAAENIEATEEELNAKADEQIEAMAKAYQMEADKIREIFGEEQMNAMKESLKSDMAVQKAIDLIVAESVEA